MAPVQVNSNVPRTPQIKSSTSSAPDPKQPDQNIQVFVRCRPLKPTEKRNVVEMIEERNEVRVNEHRNVISGPVDRLSKTFFYDSVFDVDTEQIEVYRAVVAPLIEQVVMGFNCTVFAYGQTGTGKTYTMEGERSDDDLSWETDPKSGIIPRALHQLFETLQDQNNEYTVRVSFLEMYNEEVYDLLSPLDDTKKLKIFEDSCRKGSVIVSDLDEVIVNTKAEIYDILRKGSAKRQTAATLLNACSSRSHTIFAVTVHVKENSIDGENLVKIGKLNLVDLAGSENIGRSGAIEKRAREAGNINQSLLTLGRVITSLVEKAPHIPYRESKLTRLLRDSLGGRTKTSIIATISPNALDAEDTLSTLDYAQRAKKITNKPEVNQKLTTKALFREYAAEIEKLKKDLAATREVNGFIVDKENYNSMVENLDLQEKEIRDLEAKIKSKIELFEKIQVQFSETKEELEKKEAQLEETTTNLKETKTVLLKTESSLKEVTVDRNEHKHLVQVHQTTEKILSTQAKELLTIADRTTEDVSKLHEKVDRQRTIETTNKGKLSQFEANFANNMAKLEELVRCSTETFSGNMADTKDAILDNLSELETAVASFNDQLQTSDAALNGQFLTLVNLNMKDRLFTECSLTLKEKLESLGTCCQISQQGLKEFLVEERERGQAEISKVVSLISQQRLAIEELLMKQNKHITRVATIRESAFEGIKKSLRKMFDNQRTEIMVCQKELETMQKKRSLSEAVTDSQLSTMEKLFQDMKAHKDSESKQFEQDMAAVVTLFDKTSEGTQKREERVVANFDKCASDLLNGDTLGLEFINEVDALSSENIQSNVNQLTAFDESNNKSHATALGMVEKSTISYKSQVEESIILSNDLALMTEKSVAKKEAEVGITRDKWSESLQQLKEHFAHSSVKMVGAKKTVTQEMRQLETLFPGVVRPFLREARTRASELGHLLKNELVESLPTGMTPRKTTYNYPKDLVATSPHERVLRRFRAAVDTSYAAHTDLPDGTDSELLSDTCNSSCETESIASNGENTDPISDLTPKPVAGPEKKGKKISTVVKSEHFPKQGRESSKRKENQTKSGPLKTFN